ncbi:MAG: glycosyltransferase [Actinobacteria bacterium]|nr:glycosyltransferase [Actinomycetota bacterium]
MQKFTPYYIGSRLLNKKLSLPDDRIYVINKTRKLSYINEYLFKRWGISPPNFIKNIKQVNPKIIHAHFGIGGALALPLCKELNIPLITTFHGYDITVKDEIARKSFLGHRMFLKRRKELSKKGSLFIAVSNFIKNKLYDKGFPSDKIVVHYIGIDTEYWKPSSNIIREPIILFVGRLVEKKGCKFLIKAMSLVGKKFDKVRLIIIGDGPQRKNLESLARKMLRNYDFLGEVRSEVVKYWMNQAQVFCVPSIEAQNGDSEAFGMVFAEAQVMGVPVVSHNHGGIPEVVINGKTGFLVKEKDYNAIAKNIYLLLTNNDLRNKMAKAGSIHIISNFDLKKQSDQLENIYQDIVKTRFYI